MIYCETINKECIAVRPLDDEKNTQYVNIVKYGDTPMFAVCMDIGDFELIWEFEMNCPSDYERVKMSVFDAIFVCETMTELAEAFDDIFENDFKDILIVDECGECNSCKGCCMQ